MFDVFSDPEPPTKPEEQNPPEVPEKKEQRKFIGVKFNCCGIYVRVYINKEGTRYEGRCPKCFQTVNFKVGEGGTENRFFETR